LLLNGLFLFSGPFFPKDVHTRPKFYSGFLILHLWSDLPEIVPHLLSGCPSMAGAMVNIADVPFTLGSGRIEHQLVSFEKEDTVLTICLDDIQESFWQNEILRGHFSKPLSVYALIRKV